MSLTLVPDTPQNESLPNDSVDARPMWAGTAIVGAAIFTPNIHRIGAFYERLFGITLDRRNHDDGRIHWICEIGAVHFEIKSTVTADGTPTPDAVEGGGSHSNIELSLRVENAAEMAAIAQNLGATVHQTVETYPWGDFGVVLDPDGNRIGLYSQPTDSEGDA